MRLGAICRADNTGLGNQTYEFYKHMSPHKTMVVDISAYNGNKQFPERYPGATFISGFPTNADIDRFLNDLDVVFLAEAPYNYYLYTAAKNKGVKVANQYNYEFFDWFANPTFPRPDMLIAPSKWNYDHIEGFARDNSIVHTYLHCPVNRDLLPRRGITQAKRFLHIAGRPAAHDRNGTFDLIMASRFVRSNIKIIIKFQGEQGLIHQLTSTTKDYINYARRHGNLNKLIIQVQEHPDYASIYNDGDVMVLPRRYGGNCLPMNEALSCGMPVIMPNIDPNNAFLPEEWLVSATKKGEFTPRTTIDIYTTDPRQLAAKIDYFAQLSTHHMQQENDRADQLAETISWQNMAKEYREALEALCM